METKIIIEDSEKIVEIIKDYKNKPNKDLVKAMNYIQKDFDFTKDSILKLSNHLDKLELSYNTLLKEYKSRNA
jgi:hypothetical protein